MTDSQKVLAVLEAARGRVAQSWGKGMWSWSDDQPCASAAILIEIRDESYSLGIAYAAHVAFLRGAGIRVPGGERATREAVWRFNDAQRTVDPVLGAFVKAIAAVRAELEPEPPLKGEQNSGQEREWDVINGCPQPVWDGSYKMRCGLGGDGTMCARHGQFQKERRIRHEHDLPEPNSVIPSVEEDGSHLRSVSEVVGLPQKDKEYDT